MQVNFKYVKISKNGGQLHVLSNLADRCHVLSSTCLVMFNVLIKNENPNIVGPAVIRSKLVTYCWCNIVLKMLANLALQLISEYL